MNDRILVTGGTGTTGRIIANLLRDRGVEARIATRRPAVGGQIRFDWTDATTFEPALSGVDAVYLVAPTDHTDHLTVMRPFLQMAVSRGAAPLVLLSAAALDEGGPMMGQVQAWLRANAPRWISLRPSWFMQNFVGQHLSSIVEERRIYSATGDGRVAFIDVGDIARAAVAALTDPGLANGEIVLTGPAAISYDDVAAAISHVAGTPIEHHRLTVDELAQRHVTHGLPENYAALLAGMDVSVARGAEDRTTDGVERLTGNLPVSLEQFLHREAGRFRTRNVGTRD